MRYQKGRAEKREITENTVPQFYKPIKLLCDINDVLLNWKKITRGFPKGRRYGDYRAPSVAELKAILAYPDRRIEPIVLTACSGRLGNGAWDYLKWFPSIPVLEMSYGFQSDGNQTLEHSPGAVKQGKNRTRKALDPTDSGFESGSKSSIQD